MRGTALMTLADPEWLEVLRAEAARPERSKQAIADELGISRTAVSLLCAGKYPAGMNRVTRKIAGEIMRRYANRVWCPHRRRAIGGEECLANRSAPMSMSDPAALRQWAACRTCRENPDAEVPDVAV